MLINNDLRTSIQNYLQARTSYNRSMPTINLKDSELEAMLNPQSEGETGLPKEAVDELAKFLEKNRRNMTKQDLEIELETLQN